MQRFRGAWRLLSVLALASAALTGSAARAAAESVTVHPAAGNQNQTFVFAGAGFSPGTTLEVHFDSPDGQQFTLLSNGAPSVMLVGPDGSFRLEILPYRDFSGAEAGSWDAEFCISGTADCWQGDFDIAL